MKTKLLNAVKANPGCRISTLAAIAGMNKISAINFIYELEDESKVYSVAHHDTANMEFYNKWYAKEVK